ncbi:MAG: hypothetical protein CVU50_06740 [Candidatus Cloacimonetes bacterium HGW-Cloacimonetes-3]|nr:MAG: hypothetical protein CVU50_06740 [Candidatus Cloacimonetes bacterium HGW-Cloacimonetes-3]
MKKLLLITVLCMLAAFGFAQLMSEYSFAYSAGTYTEITGGTVLGTTTSDDQKFVTPLTPAGGTGTTGIGFPIGFNFTFGGVVYDRVAINNNGWISLGQSALTPSINMASTSSYFPLGSTSTISPTQLVGRIAGMSLDLQGQTDSELRIETVGTDPDQELVVQWKNYREYGSSGQSYNFQIRLQQNGNKVVVTYGTVTNGATPFVAQAGLRNEPATPATNFKNLSTTTDWTNPAVGGTAAAQLTLSDAVYPPSGTIYTWAPPVAGLPPNPAALVSPADAGTGVFPEATLNWASGGGIPTGYKLYFGTDDPPTNIENGTDMLDVTTYDPDGLMPFDATYYWQVVPYNEIDDASDCPIWSFTTISDPTVFSDELPYMENFDTVTIPTLPYGWTTRVTDVSTYGYVKTVATGYSTPNRVAFYNSSDTASDLILISPLIDPALNTLRVKFWATGGTGYTLQVGTVDVSGQSAVFTSVQTVNVASGWAQYSVSLAAYAGTNQYIAFRHGHGDTYRTIYIDDVSIEVPAPIAPEAATLVSPADASINLLNPILKWTPSATGEPPTGYKVYMNDSGTFSEGDVIYNGTNTSFTTTTTAYGRTYYWQVVPYNATGPATGNSTRSFTVVTETQLAESFEPTSFPPAGWANGSTGNWTRSTSYPVDGVGTAYKYGSSTAQYILSAPRCTIDGSSTLDFWTASGSTSGTLQVVYSEDRTTWTQIGADITYAATYTMYNNVIDLSSLAGNNYYIGFRTGLYSTSYYVDKVIGPEITAEAPGPVTQVLPADLAIDQEVRPTLTWTAAVTGGIPTGYKVYCDETGAFTAPIATVTASPYTFTSDLTWEHTYYWKVVAYNGTGDAVGSTTRSFTVKADPTITTFAYVIDFGTTTSDPFPPTNWSRMDGLYGGTYASGSQWIMDDWLNVTTPANKAAKINIYGTSRYGWLVTPPINIPTDNFELKFDMALLDWNGTIPPVAGEQADDKLIVVMSDSPTMDSPIILREWNNTMSNDVFDNIPATGENYVIPLIGITGIKYFAFYGESTVSGGDNDLMIDNIIIRQIPAGAPDNVTLNSPVNHDATVNPESVTLSWTPAITGGNPDGYSIFVGENPIDPANEYFGDYEYSTTNTSFDLSAEDIVIGYEQTLYWAVWPYNGDPAQYPDPNDPSFQTFDFTTIADPRIVSLPYVQNFDGVSTPALPVAWTGYKSNSGMTVTTSTSTPQSTPNNVYMYNSSYTSDTLRLITPEVVVAMNTAKISFYARSSSAGYVLQVGTVSALDGTGVFTELASYPLTTTHTQYTLSLTGYVGTDQYICFQHGQGGSYRSLYIDSFMMEEVMANDLAATAVSGPGIGTAGTELSYDVTVLNNGTVSQSSYNVHLKRFGDDRLASIAITDPLAPGASAVHTIYWTPTTGGDYVLVGEVELTGDEYAGNNESATMNSSIYAAGTFLPQIGDIASATTSYYTPINAYYKNNLSETVYLAHEMQATSGTINAIIYQNNYTQDVTKPVKIWMKHTTEANVFTAYLPFAGYELVFDGNVFMPQGVNAVVIPLDTPFAYTGGNLAVRVYSVWEDFYYSLNDKFYYTASPEYPDRTRYFQADQTSAFDPIALTDYNDVAFTGNLLSYIPNTAFVMSPAVPIITIDAPALAVSQNGTNAQLDWDAVAGAYAYRVYASDDPYLFEGAPIATVYTNTYSAAFAANAKKFYQVVAISYHHTDSSKVMNPAAVIGFDNSKLKHKATIKNTGNKK